MTDRLTIPERPVEGKRLGRHIIHDARNARFPAEQATQIVSVIHNSWGQPLDQGQIGSCTANALVGCLNSVPHLQYGQKPLTEADAKSLYHAETVLEGQPWPPNDPGGTGLEVCEAAQARGWLRGYTHATGVQAALRALVIRPVITGINWYSSMDTPDADGIVTLGGQLRGGHEIVATQIDADKRLVWFWNSWGVSWGLKGRFAMDWDTWDALLQRGGDVTVPLTKKDWNA